MNKNGGRKVSLMTIGVYSCCHGDPALRGSKINGES